MEPDRLRAVVSLAQKGRGEGFEALLEAYGARLFAYFLRATGSRHDAEDLLGEMMLKLVRRLKSYVDRGRFDQWLFRIAANMVRDRIRRARVRPPTMSLAQGGDDEPAMDQHLAGGQPPVDAAMLAAEGSGRLQAALKRLDETTRQMILLRHFGDMSFKEIAEVFDCPLGTALARVHRGLQMMRKWMQDDEDDSA